MISLQNQVLVYYKVDIFLFLFYKIIIIDIDTIFRLDYRVIVM